VLCWRCPLSVRLALFCAESARMALAIIDLVETGKVAL